MDVLESDFSFSGHENSGSESPIRVAFLGTRHPHVMYRFAILDMMSGFEAIGFYEEDSDIAEVSSPVCQL